MPDPASEIYKRFIKDPMAAAPIVLNNAKSSKINGLPIPNFVAKSYIPKIEKNPAPYLESLKKINPDRVINFIKKNPDIFKGVQNGTNQITSKISSMNKHAQTYITEMQKNGFTLPQVLAMLAVTGGVGVAAQAGLKALKDKHREATLPKNLFGLFDEKNRKTYDQNNANNVQRNMFATGGALGGGTLGLMLPSKIRAPAAVIGAAAGTIAGRMSGKKIVQKDKGYAEFFSGKK